MGLMARTWTIFLAAAGLGAAPTLIEAGQPSALAQAQPGLWEISGVPGSSTPQRECIADLATLTRYEHRTTNCSTNVLREGGNSTAVNYTCGGAGFGHSQIDVITPRSLRISTQGISGGLPFNYVLQARRIDDCPKSTTATRH